jgi:superfamily I DNA/RNA helicase
MELSILRKLVPEDNNDMFLCGDIAQQVHTKHHKITHTGINIVGRSQKIRQNYRNSREILKAAYATLHENVDINEIYTDGFEIIEPKYANFSTPKPLLIKANTLEEELVRALSYLHKYQRENEKTCIAFAGLSLHQVRALGEELDIDVLDSVTNINDGDIFLSDLDQTKGFEFDLMMVLNCKDRTIPDTSLPEPEWYRDICKLYVAMTRAKQALFVSYHHIPSRIFKDIQDYFVIDEWANQVDVVKKYEGLEIKRNNRYIFDRKKDRLSLTGKEFLYTKYAVGMPNEVQNKLLELVKGKNSTFDGKKKGWKTVYELFKDNDVPNVSKQMGIKTYSQFKEFIELNL